MTDREGIIRLATEYMGWSVVGFEDGDRRGDSLPRLVEQASFKPNGDRHWYLITGNSRTERVIDFFESPADAFELESAIPEAKRHKYLLRLYDSIVGNTPIIGTTRLYWGLAHATPRQRAQAALAVLDTEGR
jgi:hypothetical protein